MLHTYLFVCLVKIFRIKDLSESLKAEKRTSRIVAKKNEVLRRQTKVIKDNQRVMAFYRNECKRHNEVKEENKQLKDEKNALTKE